MFKSASMWIDSVFDADQRATGNSGCIQASGRVGRDTVNPGLVVSLLRSTKPRDLSHYEMRRSFHQEMYRHVDITTTTPFSPRAFDRAMPSILMLLIRQGLELPRKMMGFENWSIQQSKEKEWPFWISSSKAS